MICGLGGTAEPVAEWEAVVGVKNIRRSCGFGDGL